MFWNPVKNDYHSFIITSTDLLRTNRNIKVVCLYFAGKIWGLATSTQKKKKYTHTKKKHKLYKIYISYRYVKHVDFLAKINKIGGQYFH